jgi:hypothetical protein
MAAVIVSAWLVEAKQSVIENMAPVLTRVFTPLFAATLLAFLVAIIWTNNGIDVERDALILFDLLLVIVLGLLLYAISARDLTARPSLFDRLQLASSPSRHCSTSLEPDPARSSPGLQVWLGETVLVITQWFFPLDRS